MATKSSHNLLFSFSSFCLYSCRFPKLSSYLVYLFFLFIICFSVGLVAGEHKRSLHSSFSSPWKLDVARNLGFVYKRRVARSPFMPPSVTSFKPPLRRAKGKKLDVQVGGQSMPLLPPIIRGQATSPKKKTNQNGAQPPRATSVGRSRLPRPPVVVQQSNPKTTPVPKNKTEDMPKPSSLGPPRMPQNDQHLSSDMNISEPLTDEAKRDRDEYNEVKKTELLKPKEPEPSVSFDSSSHQEILGFYEVLEAIGRTTEELQDILRKENVSLDRFLEFIDHGTTKDKVLEFLNLQRAGKHGIKDLGEIKASSKSDPMAKVIYKNEPYEIDRKKVLLMDLPFTEIVHDVPVSRGKISYKKQLNSGFGSQDSERSTNRYSKKWEKKERGSKFTKKRNKKKNDNPFLMNSASGSILPAKDAPIVMPFLPPKKKQDRKTKKHSASIISLSIQRTSSQMISDASPQVLASRNKLHSGKDTRSDAPADTQGSYYNSKDGKGWNNNSSKQQLKQSNLRMVFPMRGILMFCGILGAVAAVTILILIIYGTVKCNKKSALDSYQMTECKDISSPTS